MAVPLQTTSRTLPSHNTEQNHARLETHAMMKVSSVRVRQWNRPTPVDQPAAPVQWRGWRHCTPPVCRCNGGLRPDVCALVHQQRVALCYACSACLPRRVCNPRHQVHVQLRTASSGRSRRRCSRLKAAGRHAGPSNRQRPE
jgi:hypothetical protein